MKQSGPPAILDRLCEELEKRGGCAPVSEVVAELLRTDDGALGGRVLLPLIGGDRRFHVEDEEVRLNLPEAPISGELMETAFAVLDFETNGLSGADRAVEIGVACFKGGREINSFESLLDPGTPISPFVTRLTGITGADLRGKPAFRNVWPEVKCMIEGKILVAHNMPFDGRILKRELEHIGEGSGENFDSLCTLKLARRVLPKEEKKGLDALASRFGLTFTSRHRALDDARMAGRILYRLFDIASDRFSITTLDQLRDFLQ